MEVCWIKAESQIQKPVDDVRLSQRYFEITHKIFKWPVAYAVHNCVHIVLEEVAISSCNSYCRSI